MREALEWCGCAPRAAKMCFVKRVLRFRSMREFLHRLLERLHDSERPLSRNKHFHAFTGGAKGALRIDRHLRDLETQLTKLRERDERPRVLRLADGGAQLVLTDARLAVVRTATLTPQEVALLARHPAGAWALEEKSSLTESDEAAHETDSGAAAANGRK